MSHPLTHRRDLGRTPNLLRQPRSSCHLYSFILHVLVLGLSTSSSSTVTYRLHHLYLHLQRTS
jgi:energy-converting hydrogenase Eha subunit F